MSNKPEPRNYQQMVRITRDGNKSGSPTQGHHYGNLREVAPSVMDGINEKIQNDSSVSPAIKKFANSF
ncbi:MAG: hypothetical protein ACI936_002966 [Paraglaciecola sp.]|jgi:hypothetical protein